MSHGGINEPSESPAVPVTFVNQEKHGYGFRTPLHDELLFDLNVGFRGVLLQVGPV